jgi:hypothetical protein
MATIHSNNSHKTLDSDPQNVPQALEPQGSTKLPDGVAPLPPLAPGPALGSLPTSVQSPSIEAEQVTEAPSEITIAPALRTVPKHRLSLKMAIIASGITVAIVGSAIAGNYFRTEQYNKIAQAETLLRETCNTTTLSDAEALNTAEAGWNKATTQLQGIPPFPGFGVKDAQALTSKYALCKTNIDATKLFQEAATMSEAARDAVQRLPVLPEEEWADHVVKLEAAIEHLDLIQNSFGNPVDLKASLPIFGDAQNRLKEYQQILTVAQNQRDGEHTAVQNFNDAKGLYQQFAANQGTTDATKRKDAEANLRGAIDRLRKIPTEGTTVSAEAIKTRKTYNEALDEFINEPVKQKLRNFATSFNQLSSALKSGMSTAEFASSIDSIGNELKLLQQASNTSQHPALRYFQEALTDYQFSQRLLIMLTICETSNECFTGVLDNDVYLLPTSHQFYRKLSDFYHANQELTRKGLAVRLTGKEKTAFDAIWEHADRNIEKAEQLIEQ